MSVPFSGSLKRSGGLTQAIAHQLKTLNLKPAQKIQIKFDPFHDKAEETRNFLFHISTPKVLKTNLNCFIKTQVLCDRSDPTVSIDLTNGEQVVFKSANLTALEMLQLYNQHITALVPKEEPTEKIATKATKKSGKR